MRIIFTAILLYVLVLSSLGQKISIDTLIIPRIENITNLQLENLIFPVIVTGNEQVDIAINTDLKNRFTNSEYPGMSFDSAIIIWARESLVYLDFEVSYIKNGLISLSISAEGCGAHCQAWTDYFTYNYITGQFVTLDQIIDTTGNFKSRVFADKTIQYELQKRELEEMLLDKNSGLDRDIYEWALEHYENCDFEFALKSFSLHDDYLEIVEDCYLPNAIKNLTPIIVLKYKYNDIKNELKIKI